MQNNLNVMNKSQVIFLMNLQTNLSLMEIKMFNYSLKPESLKNT